MDFEIPAALEPYVAAYPELCGMVLAAAVILVVGFLLYGPLPVKEEDDEQH